MICKVHNLPNLRVFLFGSQCSNSLEDEKKTKKDKKEEKKVSHTKPKTSLTYNAERVIGNGSFGVVYQARVAETGETVAIKKVYQDKRYKNREL